MKRLFLIATFLLFGGCGGENNPTTDSSSRLPAQDKSIYFIDYYKERATNIVVDGGSYMIHQLSYKFMNEQLVNTHDKYLISLKNESFLHIDINYSWGYRYKVSGYFDEHVMDDTVFVLDEIISIEKHFEPFTLVLTTYNEMKRPLITQTSNDTYLAYNELEFKVYDQDLQENLDLRIDNNYTVTLTFDFEDNGTIFLKQIEE